MEVKYGRGRGRGRTVKEREERAECRYMNERKRRKREEKGLDGKETIIIKVCRGQVWERKRKYCKGTRGERAVCRYMNDKEKKNKEKGLGRKINNNEGLRRLNMGEKEDGL